ncbi:hypothetical protein SAMN05428977_103739 [Nitrosomonas sp. Nm166]|nr:hypothetical protein SAMN05428977_103739 [Nitrosomonas sp. Nm166]
MSGTPSISVYRTVTMNLLGMGIAILTVLNHFGVLPSGGLQSVPVNFELHSKESEWCWKKQPEELAKELWQLIRYY